jgi:alkylation response protein AidB-like acyl-CoA dehydrogenase
MFSTIVGSLAVLEYGTEEQKKELLPKLATGEIMLAMATAEPESNYDAKYVSAQAQARDGGYVITGTKLFVPYANIANYLLIVARTQGKAGDSDGLTVFIVDGQAKGISYNPMPAIANDKQYEVLFDNVPVSPGDILGELNNGYSIVTNITRKATAIQCAEMVGGAQRGIERMADMFIDINGARWITYQAVWRLYEGLPAEREVAIAKAFANVACQRIASSSQHLHGGIGVDVDYDLHYYFRRAKAFELRLGSTPFHLKTIEAEIGQ